LATTHRTHPAGMITTPTGPTFVKNNGQSGARSGDHTHLLLRMGWEDASIRPLADYFRWVGLAGPMMGQLREWAVRDVFSPEIAAALEARTDSPPGFWDEWSWAFL
jgi:hypothetical protein